MTINIIVETFVRHSYALIRFDPQSIENLKMKSNHVETEWANNTKKKTMKFHAVCAVLIFHSGCSIRFLPLIKLAPQIQAAFLSLSPSLAQRIHSHRGFCVLSRARKLFCGQTLSAMWWMFREQNRTNNSHLYPSLSRLCRVRHSIVFGECLARTFGCVWQFSGAVSAIQRSV